MAPSNSCLKTVSNVENKISEHSMANSSSITVHKLWINTNQQTIINPPTKNVCANCKKEFSNSFSYRRHLKACNKAKVRFRFKCSECSNAFPSAKMFMKHMPVLHADIALKSGKFVFATNEEFDHWKLEIEKETGSFFSKVWKQKRSVGNLTKTESYGCHRSGCFVSRGTGKRKVKRKGSNKCGFFCPASITRYVDATGGSSVMYQSTHLGHSCEVSRLYLSQPEKMLIAEQIFHGVPVPDILRKVREKASPTDRLASTSLVDVRNIAMSFGLTLNPPDRGFHEDSASLNAWLKPIMNADSSPILLFKCRGKKEDSLPFLSSDDFALGVMNNVQEDVLRSHGDDVVSVGTTTGENEHRVRLTSVVVKGGNGRGIPVALLWSNCLSENLLEVFFTAMRRRLPNLNSHTLISDDSLEYYDAWCNVFGAVDLRLVRNWLAKKRWAENALSGPNCIWDTAKRSEVLDILHSMSEETNKHIFHCSLEINTSTWLEDLDTVRFARYFMVQYAERPDLWAACYRGDAADMSWTTERWHKDLMHSKDKSGGLEKVIYHCMRSLRTQLLDPSAPLLSVNLDEKAFETRKCHRLAEGVFKQNQISPQESPDGNAWLVPSFSKEGVAYRVEQLDIRSHDCNLRCIECMKCLHQYCCNCADSVVQFNFCKHIHLVCMNTSSKHLDSFRNAHGDNEDSTMDCTYGDSTADQYSTEGETEENSTVEHCTAESSIVDNCINGHIEGNSAMDEASRPARLNLRQKARDVLDDFLPYLDALTSNKAFEEVIRTMEVLKGKLQAIEDEGIS